MRTTEPEIGQSFEIEELVMAQEMVAGLPFGGTKLAVSTKHEAVPEAIEITPPRCFIAFWSIWKRADGRIVVDAVRDHDEAGNYDVEHLEFERMEDALAAVRAELIAG